MSIGAGLEGWTFVTSCPALGPLVTPTRRPSELPALGGYGRAEAGGERG